MKQPKQNREKPATLSPAQQQEPGQEAAFSTSLAPPRLRVTASATPPPPVQFNRPFSKFRGKSEAGKKEAKKQLDEREKGDSVIEGTELAGGPLSTANDAVWDTYFAIGGKDDDGNDLRQGQEYHGMSEADAETQRDGLIKAYNITGLTATLKVASALTRLYQSSQEKGNWGKFVEAAFDLGSGVYGTASAVSGIISDYTAEGSNAQEQSSEVSTYTFVADSMIQSLKGGYVTIKKIVEAIKTANDKDVKSGHLEKADEAKDIIGSASQTIVSTIKTIREVIELAGGSVTGWGQAVPIMGLALAALDVAFRVYDLVKSGKALKEMKAQQEGLEANMTPAKKKNFIEKVFGKGKGHEVAGAADANKEEYDFVSHMVYINQKRIARASIHIGLDLVKIGGEIATLTGVGATAGVPMKTAAAGFEVAMGIFRKIKQTGRDYAAKKDADPRWREVFNTDKSTDNKNAEYSKDIGYIFSRIADLQNYDDKQLPQKKQQVYNYIHAAGAVPTTLFRTFTSADTDEKGMEKTVKYLLECMKSRG